MNILRTEFKTILRKMLFILLAFLTLSFFSPNKTYATSGTVSTIATNAGNISIDFGTPTNFGFQRKIARDSVGNLYTVYNSRGSDPVANIYMAKSTDNGLNWSSQALTAVLDYNQKFPTIAVDSQDNLHVAWKAATTDDSINYGTAKINYREYANGSWQPITTISTYDGNNQADPGIAVDSQDNVHVVWIGATADSPNKFQTHYREYTNGAWQTITEITTNSSYGNWDPAIAVDSQDNIHIVWAGNTDASQANLQIRYEKRTNGAWGSITEITSNPSYDQEYSAIAIDSQDNPHVVWGGNTAGAPDNFQIRYREYANGAWQTITELTTEPDNWQEFPSIAFDSHDNLRVAWDGYTDDSPDLTVIRYLEYTNGAWQPIEVLASSAQGDELAPAFIWAEWPKICDARTNITKDGFFMLWTDSIGNYYDDYTNFDVKTYVSSDLAWQTESCPEPTPTPTPALTILPQTGADLSF